MICNRPFTTQTYHGTFKQKIIFYGALFNFDVDMDMEPFVLRRHLPQQSLVFSEIYI